MTNLISILEIVAAFAELHLKCLAQAPMSVKTIPKYLKESLFYRVPNQIPTVFWLSFPKKHTLDLVLLIFKQLLEE